MRPVSVLIIDDDPNIRNLLLELLSGRSEYRVLVAGDGKTAVRCFVEEKVDVVLTDIHMPGFTGLELMADMKKVKFKPEILVMTANATPENVETARQIGARSVILKPFDNLDVVEAEIEKAARAVMEGARESGSGQGEGRPAAPAVPARAASPPAKTAAPAKAAAAPARATVSPAKAAVAPPRPAAPPPPAKVAAPVAIPDIDAWQVDLVGNDTPPPAPVDRGPRTPPAAPRTMSAPPKAPSPSRVERPAAPAAAPAPSPLPPPIEAAAAEPAERAMVESAPEIPSDLDDLFRMAGSLDVGKMRMQMPIVCLQTWEEKQAIAALRGAAAALGRDFFVWSAAQGLLKDGGQAFGEIYREPARALEFIRRQKQAGLYLLADFRQCLEDRMVVRVLREMVMDMETARALLVLTAPRLPIPPELQPACAVFDWPAGGGADVESLYDEVAAEVASSTGRAARLDRASREALFARVREMPAGRARFEIARALMALTKRAS